MARERNDGTPVLEWSPEQYDREFEPFRVGTYALVENVAVSGAPFVVGFFPTQAAAVLEIGRRIEITDEAGFLIVDVETREVIMEGVGSRGPITSARVETFIDAAVAVYERTSWSET